MPGLHHPARSAAGPLAGLRRAARRGRALERRPRPAASARPRRALAAAALLALPLLAALAPAAQAQDTLVSNTGQPLLLATGNQVAVAFTTGSNGYGYTLSAVDIPLQTVSSRDTVVTIRAGGGANPGALVATLANPSSFTRDALNTFTAPAGTTLAASTTYFLVVNDGRNLAAANVVLTVTTSDAQTGAAGWSIADTGRFVSGGNWRNGPGLGTSIRFALKGAPNGPAAPTGLTATAGPGSGQVTLRWTDPGDSRITRWQWDNWRGTPGQWGGWRNMGGSADRTSFTRGNLDNGTQYGWRIRACAGDSCGAASDAATATPAANPPPAKPTGLTATAGDGEVTLSWDNPRDGRITHWQRRVRVGSAAWSPWATLAAGSVPNFRLVQTGLLNGATYSYQIRATVGAPGADGTLVGPTSDIVSASPRLPPPAKPTGLTATPGNQQVTLSWTNPGDSGIASWQHRRRTPPDSGAWGSWLGISGSDADTTTHTVTGLANGTAYGFQVRAVADINSASAPSDAVSATPMAPTPTVEFADDSAASLSEGASFARGYTLVLDPAPTAAITVTYTVTGTATRGTDFTTSGSAAVGAGIDEVDISVAVVQDALREGDETVILTLADGAGYDLGGRTTVTLTIEDDDPPLAPAGLAAAAGDGQVVLSWTDPSDAAISGYQFRQRTPPDTGSWGTWTAIASSTATTTTHTVTGLTNGTAYGFQVRALDGTLEGAASSEATATPTAAATAGVTTAQPTDRQVTEGDTSDTATFTVALSTRPSDIVSVTVTAPAPAGLELAGPGGSTFSGSATLAFTASTWNSAQTVTMRATDDSTDSPIGRELSVTYRTSSRDSSYHSLSGTAATVTVVDNDPTAVTLAGAAGDVAEGGTKTFTITLGRGLVNGETLPVPLTFGGGATRGADYTTACPTTLPTGVACANLDSGNATVTFTGPSTGTTADSVTLTLSATTDSTAEPGGETVAIGLGTLNANSGTGLGGGASGTDSLADFSITDPDTSVPTVEITGVPDRISGTGDITATFTFSEDVTGFATGDVTVTGGTKGTFTATSATVYTLAVTPDGGANVVVTVAANAATDGTNTGPASAEAATAVWTALVFDPAAVTVVEEASATYTVALSSQPDGNVTVTVGGASGEVTFDTDSTTPGTQTTALTFSTTNWSTPRTVTVLAAADGDTANDTATLTHAASGGGYGSVTGSVAVTVADNDAPGLVLDPTSLTVAEGGSGAYTVALATQPTGNVTVTVAGASGDVTVDTDSTANGDQSTLTFTTTTWSTPRTVTVSAGQDNDTTNDTATLTHAASGGGYGSVTGSVAVTVEDDDTVGVTTATTDDTATEGSTSDTATFTVVLNTQPSSGVTVTVTAPRGLELDGPDAGSTFGSSEALTFTDSNWGTAQTVTVRAATDDSTDSPIGRELTVTWASTSSDTDYNSLSGDAATVTVVDNDPTAVTLAGSAGDVVEGGTKTFTITLNRGLVNGETLPVPLTFGTGSGAATRNTDYTVACPTPLPTGVTCNDLNTAATPTVTFTGASGSTTATTVTLTLSATTDSTTETGGETVIIGLGTLNANSGTGLGGGASGTDTLADFRITDPDSSAPTVEISGVPGTINNRDAFTATFTFSEAVTGFVKDDITVIGGTAGDFTATSATVYTLVVTPNADADVVVTVAADSATAGTNTGPASAVSATAVWTLPPGLVFSSTALTVAEGGSGTYTVKLATQPTVTVTVTVGGASGEVTVDTDANTNGNQRTLIFTATNWGTARTVTVLAGEDEDSVNDTATLTHRASGGGYGSVTGTVVVTVTDNDEPSVFGGFAAWMPRFARVASEQILQGIGERVALHRGQGATGSAGAGRGDGAMAFEGVLAGQALVTGGGFADGGRGISAVPGRAAAGGAAQAMVERARGFGEEASDPFGDRLGAPRSQTLGAREALLGTAFTLTGERDGAGGTMAFWGQAGRGDFDGRERTLLLDGEVTTGMLGVDYAWDRALVGLALTRSEGEGGYRDTHSASRAGDGEVEASLTAALPYASVHATPRLKLWGATGRGGGEVTLKTPDARYRANTEWTMAAAGMRGDFLTPLPEGAGASLALTADALWTRITSDRTRGLAASASSVTRVRLGLEGRYPLALDGDGQLTPRFEARARQDGGDAETGRGFELGAGLAFSDPALGLTLDLSGRTLIAHTDDDLKERGYQASLAFDPDPATKRGPSLGLRQEFGGRAEGGLDALFASAPLGERTGRGAKPRWAMETAWGFPALGGRFTASPHAGLGLAADAREISLGWRLTPEASTAPDLSLGLKAARRERNTALPQHTFGVEAALRW